MRQFYAAEVIGGVGGAEVGGCWGDPKVEEQPQIPPLRYAPVGMTDVWGAGEGEEQKQIHCGNDRQKSSDKCRSLGPLTPLTIRP